MIKVYLILRTDHYVNELLSIVPGAALNARLEFKPQNFFRAPQVLAPVRATLLIGSCRERTLLRCTAKCLDGKTAAQRGEWEIRRSLSKHDVPAGHGGADID